MPRSWQYPRWRRILMQITLWLVLGAAVGLAELVVRQSVHASPSSLQSHQLSALTIRLPSDWTVVTGGNNSALLVAREKTTSGQPRTFILSQKVVAPNVSPQDFLLHSGMLIGAVAADDQVDDSDNPQPLPPQLHPIRVAGLPGVMTSILQPHDNLPDMRPDFLHESIAIAILPHDTALILVLTGGDQDTSTDAELLQQIAGEITLK